MGNPGRPPLSSPSPTKPPRPVLPAPIVQLAYRLRLGMRLQAGGRNDGHGPESQGGGGHGPELPHDPLLAAGRRLREAREAAGLGLRQLAQDTRISTPVLEALERGWRDRLPEAAYLRTMLPLLERRLGLEEGCLDAALPPERLRFHGPRREPLLRRFTPGSIDVFTTWQGTLLYGLLSLLLIYGLNLQQRRLALRGLLSPQPLPPMTPAAEKAASAEDSNASLLQAYPELRPLRRAADGQALQKLREEKRRPGAQPAPSARARP
jgi:transcriptional regulator with XRE-family HTH domain